MIAAGKSEALASVELLDDDERVEEIARMGTGLEITDAAREHAREMLGKAK